MIIEENCVIRKIANTREIEIDDIEIHRFFHSESNMFLHIIEVELTHPREP